MQKNIHPLHTMVTVMLFLGALFSYCGVYWDVQYHFDIGRDSFWIHPHLLIYSGVLLAWFGGIIGVLWSRTFKNKVIAKKLTYTLGTIVLGTMLIFTAAPIDDVYHRLVGIDATVWSPPHFLFSVWQKLYLHKNGWPLALLCGT